MPQLTVEVLLGKTVYGLGDTALSSRMCLLSILPTPNRSRPPRTPALKFRVHGDPLEKRLRTTIRCTSEGRPVPREIIGPSLPPTRARQSRSGGVQGPKNFRRDWHFKPIGRIRPGWRAMSVGLQGGLGGQNLYRRSCSIGRGEEVFSLGYTSPTPVASPASMRTEMSDIRKSHKSPAREKG